MIQSLSVSLIMSKASDLISSMKNVLTWGLFLLPCHSTEYSSVYVFSSLCVDLGMYMYVVRCIVQIQNSQLNKLVNVFVCGCTNCFTFHDPRTCIVKGNGDNVQC